MAEWKPTIELTSNDGIRCIFDVDDINMVGCQLITNGATVMMIKRSYLVLESVAEVNALLDRARDPEWQRLKRIEANMLAFYDAWIAEDEEAKKSLWAWIVANYSDVGVISRFPVDNLTIGLRNIRRQLAAYDANKSKRDELEKKYSDMLARYHETMLSADDLLKEIENVLLELEAL